MCITSKHKSVTYQNNLHILGFQKEYLDINNASAPFNVILHYSKSTIQTKQIYIVVSSTEYEKCSNYKQKITKIRNDTTPASGHPKEGRRNRPPYATPTG